MTATRGDRTRRLLRGGVILGSAAALVAPAWSAPTTTVLGSWRTDTVKHVWSLWLGRAMMADGPALWGHTGLVNHPDGLEMLLVEPLGAVVAALLWPLPVPLVANLLAFANLALLGFCTCVLADRVAGKDRLAGLLAALLVMGSTTTAFFFHLGVGELQHLFVVPLTLWAIERLRDAPRWQGALLLAGTLWLAALAGHYLALLTALAALAAGVGALVTGPQRGRLALALGGAAAIALIAAAPLVQGVREAGPVVNLAAEKANWHFQWLIPPRELPAARLDLARLAWPVRVEAPGIHSAYIGGQYLGPVFLALAALGLARAPRRGLPLAVVALVALVLAMGSRPVWAGVELQQWTDLVLPYAWLSALLHSVAVPPHYPARFLAAAVVALGGLAALAVAGQTSRHLRITLATLTLVGIADANLRGEQRWPWPRTELPAVDGLSGLQAVERGGVLDLSWYTAVDQEGRNLSAWYQVLHGQPTQIVPIPRLDHLHREGAARARALPLVRDLSEEEPLAASGSPPAQDYQVDIALLREDGFAWVLLFGERLTADGRERIGARGLPAARVDAVSRVLGPATFEEGPVAVWRLPVTSPPEDALQVARETRARAQPAAEDRLFGTAR